MPGNKHESRLWNVLLIGNSIAALIEDVRAKTLSEKWETYPKKSNKHGERNRPHRFVTH